MLVIIEHELQRKIKCRNCKALLDYTIADVECDLGRMNELVNYIIYPNTIADVECDLGRMNELVNYIICPNCGEKLFSKSDY